MHRSFKSPFAHRRVAHRLMSFGVLLLFISTMSLPTAQGQVATVATPPLERRENPPRSFRPAPLDARAGQRQGVTTAASRSAGPPHAVGLSTLPLSFQPNVGQTDAAVRFLAAGRGGSVFFRAQGIVIARPPSPSSSADHGDAETRRGGLEHRRAAQQPGADRAGSVVQIHFLGANSVPNVVGLNVQRGRTNYLLGTDQRRWKTNVATFASVEYQRLYPGIDLRYDGTDGQLKSTFTVAAGVDPQRIRWRYADALDARVDATTGDLHIELPAPTAADAQSGTNTVVERAPQAWQIIAGQQVSVDVGYGVAADGSIGFKLGSYDPTHDLIIDPTLEYNTVVGGLGGDTPEGVAVDQDGNVYVAGFTHSPDFPLASQNQGPGGPLYGLDGYVFKLDPSGQELLYSTYLGGSADDAVSDIAVDSYGNAYVTGTTFSSNLPGRSGVQPTFKGGKCIYDTVCPDAFVARLNAGGGLSFSSYLGGMGDDDGAGVAVGLDGTITVVGSTTSDDFPQAGALQPARSAGMCEVDDAKRAWPCSDTFITQISSSGRELRYSTYFGGSSADGATAVALDPDGQLVVVGSTTSADLATVRAFQGSYGGADGTYEPTDAFVLRFDPSDNRIIQSSYLGGRGADGAHDVAVDGSGHAYIVGYAQSPDFPTAAAYDSTCGTDGTCNTGTDRWGHPVAYTDAFVTKVEQDGTLAYSTFLGGAHDDAAMGLAVDLLGNVSLGGYSYSADWPTAQATATTRRGAADAVVAKLTADGTGLLFSSYVGGTSVDEGYGLALDDAGNIVLAGRTFSADYPATTRHGKVGSINTFVAKFKVELSELPADQHVQPESCPCDAGSVDVANPINTRTGNLWTRATDLSIPSAGPHLTWERTYASQATDWRASDLGFGWHHSYATRLILSTMDGGEPGLVSVISPAGNRWRFRARGDGTYAALPGIYSTFSHDSASGTYQLRARTGETITYDEAGRATVMTDDRGRRVLLSYDPVSGRLLRVADATNPARRFELHYSPAGKIAAVDAVNGAARRTVRYTYSASGDLLQADDVLQRPTTYQYHNHLLVEIKDALGQVRERTEYDQYTLAGKAVAQVQQDGQRFALDYGRDATTVTTTSASGQQTVAVYAYNAQNMLTSHTVDGQVVQQTTFDARFTPAEIVDAHGATRLTTYNRDGQPLTVTDAAGQTIRYQYNDAGRLTETTDQAGRRTVFVYDDRGNMLQMTEGITDAFPAGLTTTYQYTDDNYLLTKRSPVGVVTRYHYDSAWPGRVSAVTVGDGSQDATTTIYTYDDRGNISEVALGTAADARRDRIEYRSDGTIARVILSYEDGRFDPAYPDQDITTDYGYDQLGRPVWQRDVLGHYSVTHYNAAGQIDWTARNVVGATFDSAGYLVLPDAPPVFDPTRPDQNVVVRYRYDGFGRTTDVIESGLVAGTFNPTSRTFTRTAERVTHTIYDARGQVASVMQNYQPGAAAGQPDVNVETRYFYDAVGNQLAEQDPLGRWTLVAYDELNRPITTTVNYENGDPLTVDPANRAWTDGTDTDLITVVQYTADGQTAEEVTGYVDGRFDPEQPDQDRVTRHHYDAFGWLQSIIDPAGREIRMAYDATGRLAGQRDPLGRWTAQQYDGLGRMTATILNCRTSAGHPSPNDCAPFDAAYPDRNVRTSTTVYDQWGEVTATIDALGRRSETLRDGMGRPVATIANVQDGRFAADRPDQDVTTRRVYDGLGRAVQTIGPTGGVVQTTYDAQNRVLAVTDAAGRTRSTGYDGRGTVRWRTAPDGRITLYEVDGLGRTVAAISNYNNGLVEPSDRSDQDVIERYAYDVAGRMIRKTRSDGVVTAFDYNLRDQLIRVQEHAVESDCLAGPCNITTRFTYDRAGNQVAITDPRGSTRRFIYDAADNQTIALDPLGRATSWEYDAGGRPRVQRDPRGSQNSITYTYDDLDQRVETRSRNLSAPIVERYDALGQRVELHDATGTTRFTYDAQQRITEVTAPGTGTVRYRYNAAGDRTQLRYPDGRAIDYTYFADGQLQQVLDGATVLAAYTYDASGRLSTTARANGVTTATTYDAADQVLTLTTKRGSQIVDELRYTYNRAGQQITAAHLLAPVHLDPCDGARCRLYVPLVFGRSVGASTETKAGTHVRFMTYAYDARDQLLTAVEQGGVTYRYAYDQAGNRTGVWRDAAPVEQRTFDASDQVAGWSYDATGNLLGDDVATYTYDALQRLTSATQAGTTQTNSYNGDGLLTAQSVGASTTRFTQDLTASYPNVLATHDDDGATQYLFGRGRLAERDANTIAWHVTDQQGSVRQLLDARGNTLATAHYDPWGMPLGPARPSNFGYTGELQDGHTGLVYLRARWYQPSAGRFLSRDPFPGDDREPLSLHRYAYVHNDPINGIDPSGMYRCDGDGGASGAYVEQCGRWRQYTNKSLGWNGNNDTRSSLRHTNALLALASITNNRYLPGGSATIPARHRQNDLTPAAERLEFQLYYTRSGHAQFAIAFSDTGFGRAFRDGSVWNGYSSNQVGHFLTAAMLGYVATNDVLRATNLSCIIGHELTGDYFSGNNVRPGEQYVPEITAARQCSATTPAHFDLWSRAVGADLRGDRDSRNCALAAILPDLPERDFDFETDQRWYVERFGNSHQDLRLSLKGWVYGNAIRQGYISDLDSARAWLLTQLR